MLPIFLKKSIISLSFPSQIKENPLEGYKYPASTSHFLVSAIYTQSVHMRHKESRPHIKFYSSWFIADAYA